MLYLFVLICLIFFCIGHPRLDKIGIVGYWGLCILLIFIAGFRYNLGNDTFAYTLEYKTYPTLSELSLSFILGNKYQPFWILFESTLRTITGSFYLLQFILAAFVNYTIFKVVRQYSINPFFAIILYFLLFFVNINMEILRESIAICLLLWGIGYIDQKKHIKYYILATVAFLFHESGLVLFIVPLILNINLSKKAYFIIISSLLILSGIISFFFIEYLTKINLLFSLSKMGYFEDLVPGSTFHLFNFIKYLLMPGIVLFAFFKHLADYEKKFIFIYIVFSIIYMQIWIFYRIRDYFLLLFLISAANAIVNGFGSRSYKFYLKLGFIFCFLYIFLYRVYYNRTDPNGYQLYLNYYPYNSIINETIPQSRLDNFSKIGW